MKNRMRKPGTILCIAALLGLLAGCGGQDAATAGDAHESDNAQQDAAADADVQAKQTELTFVLDWTPNTNHTGLYVAQEKGFFEDAGLSVQIVQPPEDGAEVLVASGKAQFGISFQDSLVPAFAGENALPIQAVAAVLQHNTSGILSRAGEGMDRPRGMEGKKYATWNLDLEKATIRTVMEADGGDFDKVELIPNTVTDEVSALRSKSVDAIWVFYGWGGIAAEVAELPTDYFAFADIDSDLDFYTPVMIGNNGFMEQNPEVTKAFLSAVKKGYEYAIEDPEGAADILLKAAPELDRDLVLSSQRYMKDQYKAEVAQWGYMDPARWNAFYHWVNENGLSETELPDDTGFTNAYLEP